MMTSALLASVTEIMDADLAQIGESNISRILLHPKKDVINACHARYSIIIDIHVKVNFVGIGRFTISGAIKRVIRILQESAHGGMISSIISCGACSIVGWHEGKY